MQNATGNQRKQASCFEWEISLRSHIRSVTFTNPLRVVYLSSKSKNKCHPNFAEPGCWSEPVMSCKKTIIVFKAEISLDDRVEGIVKSASRWHTHLALCFPSKVASIQTEQSASASWAPKACGPAAERAARDLSIYFVSIRQQSGMIALKGAALKLFFYKY